jgi:hypothetical protein
MDFKRYFMTGDGLRCDPFTITDAHSRYLIRCQTVSRNGSQSGAGNLRSGNARVWVAGEDQDGPWLSLCKNWTARPSKLSLGWMKTGIVHERIQQGRPQQNGRHEGMHRTLKEDTATPPAAPAIATEKVRSVPAGVQP